jgi:hypothetical protein
LLSSTVQKEYHHTNDKQTGDIQQKPSQIRVPCNRVAMPQPELTHLFISKAIAVRADRLFPGVAQAAPFAFPGKSYSYRD